MSNSKQQAYRFIAEQIETDLYARMGSRELHDAYVTWCKARERPAWIMPISAFSRLLVRLGYEKRDITIGGRTRNGFVGVRLKTDQPDKEASGS